MAGKIILKKAYVSTNNSLEGFNRIIKEVRTEHYKLPFEEYIRVMFEEVKHRSREGAQIVSFPTKPPIAPILITLASCLSTNFGAYFVKQGQNYYIQDKYVLGSMYNKKKKTLKVKIKVLGKKIENNEVEAITDFLKYYSKPTLSDVRCFEAPTAQTKSLFLNYARIRKVQLNTDANIDLSQRILTSSCSCPDYFTIRICQHLLAVLIEEKYFKPDIELKSFKKRGR